MCGPGPTVAWKGKASRHSDRDASPFPMDLYPGIGFPMSRLEHLENEVRTLSLEELKAFRDWLSESRMLEMGTSGLMSGDGKRGVALRQYPRPSSTLPRADSSVRIRDPQQLLQ